MQRQALRGDVSGQNHGKRFLTRALTGVGTIAAFAVGGRGLTGGIDNSILLRERIASNVALAGEQEMARLAYQQNIVVTVPANTRFYLVLNQTEARRSRDADSKATSTTSKTGLSDQELQEMIQIRNEIREMNRLMHVSGANAGSPPPNIDQHRSREVKRNTDSRDHAFGPTFHRDGAIRQSGAKSGRDTAIRFHGMTSWKGEPGSHCR